MIEQKLERRLAAIMLADVVGYSRMMASDEVSTMRSLREYRKSLIDPAIAYHNGHIVNTAGDGLMAEFGSVVDAVSCGVMIQRSLQGRNGGVAEDKRIVLRIGINIGDVMVEGADVYGDGVNVAARLESICQPGGLMISRTVLDHIRAKLSFPFENLGMRDLKNIPLPVEVFGLAPDEIAKLPEETLPEAAAAPIAAPPAPPAKARRRAPLIAAGLVAIGLVSGLAIMIGMARGSNAVIVDPFDAPSSLAARGITGKAMADNLLQELVRLQKATRSTAAKRSLSNAWTGKIAVEEPESGFSLHEIDRILRAQFGHDLHIDGSLVQTETGALALTVHGNGVLAKTFTGATSDLDKMTVQAAEYVYGQSQPSIYAVYLSDSGRDQEAALFSQAAIAGADPSERPYLFNSWANALLNIDGTDLRETLPLYQQAIKLKPDYWPAYNNVIDILSVLGDEEGAWRFGQDMIKAAGGRPGRAPELYYQSLDALTWNLQAEKAALLADMNQQGGVGNLVTSDAPAVADVDARLHDAGDARIQLQTAKGDIGDPSVAALSYFVQGLLAAEAGDTKRAAENMEAFGTVDSNPLVATNYPGYSCWIAPAEEAVGQHAKADAVLAAGSRFVDCLRFKGDIADGRGDWAGAQQAYQAAVDLAPDLPAAYYSWGVALTRHRDGAGAEAKLAAANQRGPHWADPLKAWGDLLADQGRWKEALAKYDEALKYAPAWTQLQQAREAAARHKA